MKMSTFSLYLWICLFVVLNKLIPAVSWLLGIVLLAIVILKVRIYLEEKDMEKLKKNKGEKPF